MYILKYGMTFGGGYFAGMSRGREAMADHKDKAFRFESKEAANKFKKQYRIRAIAINYETGKI